MGEPPLSDGGFRVLKFTVQGFGFRVYVVNPRVFSRGPRARRAALRSDAFPGEVRVGLRGFTAFLSLLTLIFDGLSTG